MAAGCHSGPVTPSADPSPPRRPIFFPVVIATVFLTIIGMIIGFVLGERHRDRLRAEETGQSQPYDPGPATSYVPAGPYCPQATQVTAAGLGFPTPLAQVMKIQTNNGTTAWICEDGNGRFYYQGQTGGLDADLVEAKNGLFLSDVVQDGPRQYQATASNGTRFVVTEDVLEVHFTGDKKAQINKVIRNE